jgi:MFS family permease
MLMINQFGINVGFYMLMPYLATYLSTGLGMAAWTVGLVLGVRNLSQQGLFLVGGALADRFGYKPLIIAGCALRTVGFTLLGMVDSLPAVIVAVAATGFAGALFNPAVRAYVAMDSGDRRVEAFALFNVFYQSGILLGPLVGVLLTAVDFTITCLVAAAVFAALTVLQLRWLPPDSTRSTLDATRSEESSGTKSDEPPGWRSVFTNRSFLLFSMAMIGSYVLSFQTYLAIPLEVRRVVGDADTATTVMGVLFAVSGVLAIIGQLRITSWCKRHWSPDRCLWIGLAIMAAAFVPACLTSSITAGTPPSGWVAVGVALAPQVVAIILLTLGVAVVYPFEMDTVVTLARGGRVATHYGLYSTICGIGITVGNLLVGAALDLGRSTGRPMLVWLLLMIVGLLSTVALWALRHQLRTTTQETSDATPEPKAVLTSGVHSREMAELTDQFPSPFTATLWFEPAQRQPFRWFEPEPSPSMSTCFHWFDNRIGFTRLSTLPSRRARRHPIAANTLGPPGHRIIRQGRSYPGADARPEDIPYPERDHRRRVEASP